MIGKITGIVDHLAEDHALIEAGGVGYVVYCAPGTLAALPAPGGVASLYTDLVVREDLMQLFGFRTLAEREWHRLLTSVQGVGAKVSLAVLGSLGAEGVARAVASGDANTVRSAPGVGPKLAQRIVNELAGKAPEGLAFGSRTAAPRGEVSAPATPDAAPEPSTADTADATADAVSALVNLGYDRSEAVRAVAAAGEGEAPDLIRAALRSLGPAL